jgi:hypothetical protein
MLRKALPRPLVLLLKQTWRDSVVFCAAALVSWFGLFGLVWCARLSASGEQRQRDGLLDGGWRGWRRAKRKGQAGTTFVKRDRLLLWVTFSAAQDHVC